jgi:hypothetical protein
MIIFVVYVIDYLSRKLRERYIRGDDYLQGDEDKPRGGIFSIFSRRNT